MAKNPYFKDYSGESNVVEDLTIETIKAMGRDMIYIPRNLIKEDTLFGEDTVSEFDDGYPIEMYINSIDGFEGEGDLITQYGIQIRDRISLVVSRKRFMEDIGSLESITRPREGDLIYFPLSNTLFEILFVEHENPFYSLGKLYTYLLTCEVFTYSQEDIDTGITDIDKVEDDRKDFAIELTLGGRISTQTDYYEGETVYQLASGTGGTFADASSTAVVTDWGASAGVLTIANVVGLFNTGASSSVAGKVSGAEYYVSGTNTTTTIIVREPGDSRTAGDNDNIELEINQESIFDFTEKDPFSEGNY
jgi:hypothetical protein